MTIDCGFIDAVEYVLGRDGSSWPTQVGEQRSKGEENDTRCKLTLVY